MESRFLNPTWTKTESKLLWMSTRNNSANNFSKMDLLSLTQNYSRFVTRTNLRILSPIRVTKVTKSPWSATINLMTRSSWMNLQEWWRMQSCSRQLIWTLQLKSSWTFLTWLKKEVTWKYHCFKLTKHTKSLPMLTHLICCSGLRSR